MSIDDEADEIARSLGEKERTQDIRNILAWHGRAAAQHAREQAQGSGPEFFRSIQDQKKARKLAGDWPAEKFRNRNKK